MAGGDTFLDGRVTLYSGDCLAVLADLAPESVDAVVTDPPYHLQSIVDRFGATSPNDDTLTSARAREGADGLARSFRGFMGLNWDGGGVAFAPETWRAVARVLKPGGFLVAFGGTRTYHRMACAIEDAGFEVRDMLQWLYATGFPKSHSVALAIDKAAGVPPRAQSFNMKGGGDRADEFATNGREFLPPYEPTTEAARQWDGWGTALKPACEPICLARKPLALDTVAANVLRYGTGGLNIDACRVPIMDDAQVQRTTNRSQRERETGWGMNAGGPDSAPLYNADGRWPANVVHDGEALPPEVGRYFYSAKANPEDRIGSDHPTVKPVDLMAWLVRLVTAPGGVVLDPFAGSGTTGEAAHRAGCRAVLIEREPQYCADIARRLSLVTAGPMARTVAKARRKKPGAMPLFGDDP